MARNLEQVIREQKLELERLLAVPTLPRKFMQRVDVESPLAQAVLGMRRSGKSVVCRCALRDAGVKFGYVDFDDEALARLEVGDLDDVLQAVRTVYGADITHYLFDEIQNVEGWHLFVNRLLRAGNKVIVTGSNAKLLNTELATHLTGRHIPIEVFPFSFEEFRDWTGERGAEAWERYFVRGGLPETFAMADPRGYVSALYDSIVSKDILARHQVRNARRFADAAYVIMQQYAREIAYDRLAEAAGVSSAHTMQTYVGYLAESYLVSLVRKYSPKPSARIRNDKLYVADPAFVFYFKGVLGSEEELGWRLENAVYLELLRRRVDDDVEIFYYKDQSYDVDFCLMRHGKVVRLIQVAYTIAGDRTRQREQRSILGAARKLGCDDLVLITDHERETVQEKGLTLKILPASDWMTGKW